MRTCGEVLVEIIPFSEKKLAAIESQARTPDRISA